MLVPCQRADSFGVTICFTDRNLFFVRIKDIKMILEKDTRKLFVFSFLFTTYIVIGALVFQALEIGNEIKERSFIKATREKLNEKYNISDEDWNKLESILKQKNSLDPNTKWSFGNAFIFAGSVVTTVGNYKSNCYSFARDAYYSHFIPATKHTKQPVVFIFKF